MAIDDLKESLGIDDDDFKGIKDGVNALDKSTSKFRKGAKGAKSVIKAAKGNIFEFPVFVSSSVPLDYATATTSLLEQVYASFLQMAISANPVISAKSAANGTQFAHLKSDTNKYLECVDTTYQADAAFNHIGLGYTMNGDEKFIEFSLINIDDGEARVINEQCDYQPLSEFDHFFQEAPRPEQRQNGQYGVGNTSAYNTPMRVTRQVGANGAVSTRLQNNGQMSYAEAEELYYKIESLRRQIEDIDAERRAKATVTGGIEANYNYREAEAKLAKLEAEAKKLRHDASDTALELSDRKDKAQAEKLEKEKEKIEKEIENIANKYNLDLKAAERDAAKEAREAEKYEYEKSNRKAEDLDRANRGRIRAPQFMDETKIQKLNTMKPLMMTVDLNVEGKDGRIVQGVEYIVGVKAYNRLVDAATLPEVVEYPLKEMNKITRKAKWRAGELKFFKDILFKIPQKKQTAIDSRDPKRKWYRRLYELAHIKGDAPAKAIINGDSVVKAFFKDKLGKYGDTKGVIPNAALVISKADVDIIKRETKIDMLKGSSAAKFCKELFMIAIVVIDNDAESIKILMPDLHNDYEVHSLGSVNKQLSLLDTSGTKTRDMFKLLG